MIDVHIITHPTQDRSEFLHPLLEKLEKEPVTVHLLEGKVGDVGDGRSRGFRLGDRNLKSYLDDDDSVVTGIFDHILECFESESRIVGCCTREVLGAKTSGSEFPFRYYDPAHLFYVHHVTTYKYEAIAPHLDKIKEIAFTSEHMLASYVMLAGGIIKHIPRVGYLYNRNSNGISYGDVVMEDKAIALYKVVCTRIESNNYKSVISGQGSIARYNRTGSHI